MFRKKYIECCTVIIYRIGYIKRRISDIKSIISEADPYVL